MGRINVCMFPLLKITPVLVLLSGTAAAETRPTHEAMALDEIRAGFIGYAEVNGGMQATNWNQLQPFVDLTNINRRLALSGGSFPVESDYVFVTEYPLPTRSKGNIVLLRSTPFKHPTYGAGRYFVSRREDEFLRAWLNEPDFQKLLAQSGVKLPTPNPEEAQAAKAAVERLIAREQVEHQMIVAAAPKPTWAEVRAVWGERIKSWFVTSAPNGLTTGRVRVIPVTLGILLFLILGRLGWRWISKHKVSGKPEGHNG